MALSLEHSARIQQIRQAINAGEVVPIEVLREAMALLRQDRKSASAASAGAKASKAPVDTGALLAGLKASAAKITGGTNG
jgi:hypothetical protein